MGYTFTIGEAEIESFDDYIRIGAVGAVDMDAPAHDDFVGQSNSRSPSYTGWSEFCREAGITELFYGQGWSREERRHLEPSATFHRESIYLAEHPGCARIIPGDLTYVREARKAYLEKNPGAVPGFQDEIGVDNGTDSTLARLIWLEFWLDWALKNCKIPVIQNT